MVPMCLWRKGSEGGAIKAQKKGIKVAPEGGNYALPLLTSQLPSGAESLAGAGGSGRRDPGYE